MAKGTQKKLDHKVKDIAVFMKTQAGKAKPSMIMRKMKWKSITIN